MRHLDPETAALLALGEQSTSASERAHLEAVSYTHLTLPTTPYV